MNAIIQAYREAYGGLSKEVWVLSIALFVNRCGSMVLAFLTLYLTSQLGFSITQAGAIFSVFGLGSVAGSYLGGKLVKPVGAVRVQVVGLLLAGPLFCMIPGFTTWTGVALGIFILSVCSESVRPASNVSVSQFAPIELQSRAYGLQRMAVNLGMSVGPVAGGILAEFNFHWLFYVDGVTTVLAGLFLLSQFGFRRYAKNSEAAEKQRRAEQSESRESPLYDRQFICFLGLLLMTSFVFFQFHATYPKYLQEHYGLSKPQIGLVYGVNTVIIVVFEMLLLNFARDFSLLRTIGWGCLLSCLGFGILPASDATWFVVLSMVVITVGEMLTFPLATTFVAQRAQGRDSGMYMGWYAMTYSISAVIAPLAGSLAYDVHPDLFWYLSVGIGVAVLAGFYRLAVSLGRDRGAATEVGAGLSEI